MGESEQTSLDLDLCRRLGTEATFTDSQVKRLVEDRTLIMSPHPAWAIPEVIDWSVDPFEDTNWRFQFQMLRWMDPLRWAAEEGNDEALQMWLRHARAWVIKNPTSAPESPEAWMDMGDGIRALHLITALPVVADRSPGDLEWLVPALRTHADWLTDERNLGHSNHALHQHQALVALGAVLRDKEAIDLAARRMRELLVESWSDEGVNAEGAVGYHHLNYIWWHQALARFEKAGVAAPPEAERLRLAPIELAHATRPDGKFVSIGDTDGGMPRGVDHPATRWVLSKGADGEPPEDTYRLYKDGYVFARSGWGEFERAYDEETYFTVTFGDRKVHGHSDGGALTFSAAGQNWVVDPGKYSYSHETPMRRHMVAHSSHSLVYLAKQSRDRTASVSLVYEKITGRAIDLQFEDHGYPRARLLRRIIYSTQGEYLVVVDTVRSAREFTAVQRWQLGPGVTADVRRRNATLRSGNAHAIIAFHGSPPPTIQLVEASEDSCDGQVATGWKKSAPAPALLASKTGTVVRFVTVLAADPKQTPTVQRLTDMPAGHVGLQISTSRVSETMLIAHDKVTVTDGDGPISTALMTASTAPSASEPRSAGVMGVP